MIFERHRTSTTKNDLGQKFHEDRAKVAQIIEEMSINNPDSFAVTDIKNASTPNTGITSITTLISGERYWISVTREHDPRKPASSYGISKYRKLGPREDRDLCYRLEVRDYGEGLCFDDNSAQCNSSAEMALCVLDATEKFSLPDWAYKEHEPEKGRYTSVPTLTEFLYGNK